MLGGRGCHEHHVEIDGTTHTSHPPPPGRLPAIHAHIALAHLILRNLVLASLPSILLLDTSTCLPHTHTHTTHLDTRLGYPPPPSQELVFHMVGQTWQGWEKTLGINVGSPFHKPCQLHSSLGCSSDLAVLPCSHNSTSANT